jgi:hypothetical protein
MDSGALRGWRLTCDGARVAERERTTGRQLLRIEYELQSNRKVLMLVADLALGWRDLGSAWGFDKEDRIPFESESTFVCRLRLRHAKGYAAHQDLLRAFPELETVNVNGGSFSAELFGSILRVRIPIVEQRWVPTNNQSRHPSIYLFEESLFTAEIDGRHIRYDMQVWVRLHGRTRMFVPDKFEWGDGFAWVGGRPESNRRRF